MLKFQGFLKSFFQKVIYSGPTKMTLVVRGDLKMGTGKIASQCSHAAVTLYQSAVRSKSDYVTSWIRSGQPKVVLRVDHNSEEILKDLFKTAKEKNLNACLIYDAGKTQVDSNTLTVLGIGPNNTEEIDTLTKKYKLL